MRKSVFQSIAFAAMLLLSAVSFNAFAQSGGAPGFAPGQAKACSVGINGNVIEVTGIGGTCGKGSYITFNLRRVNQYMVEQVCDINRDIQRFMVAQPSEDPYVSCFYAGSVDNPDRKYLGGTVSVTVR